jgi:hypothetical protein
MKTADRYSRPLEIGKPAKGKRYADSPTVKRVKRRRINRFRKPEGKQ